jgi:phosphatidylglycerophosphate synthase
LGIDLHRALAPDWEGINPENMNMFQKLADKTDGLLTPGNAITAIGLGLTLNGVYDICNGNTKKGVIKLAAGRVCDFLDGKVADWTGTKSPAGETIDATADKIAVFGALYMLGRSEILPKRLIGSVLLQNSANAALSIFAKKSGREIHPSAEGKITSALQWGAIIAQTVSHVSGVNEDEASNPDNEDRLSDISGIIGLGLEAAATIFGAEATYGYVKDLFGIEEPQSNEV